MAEAEQSSQIDKIRENKKKGYWLKKQEIFKQNSDEYHNNIVVPKQNNLIRKKYDDFYKFCTLNEKPFESHFVGKGYKLQDSKEDINKQHSERKHIFKDHEERLNALQKENNMIASNYRECHIIPKQKEKLKSEIKNFYRFNLNSTNSINTDPELQIEEILNNVDYEECSSESSEEETLDPNDITIILKFKIMDKPCDNITIKMLTQKFGINQSAKKIYSHVKKLGFRSNKYEIRHMGPVEQFAVIPNSKDLTLKDIHLIKNTLLVISLR